MEYHHQPFDEIKRINEFGIEYWSARELSKLLEYSEYRLNRAKEACLQSEHKVNDHFEDILGMVNIGSGAQRKIKDVILSRYACYLVV